MRAHLAEYLAVALKLYTLLIFARILLSWIPSTPERLGPVTAALHSLTDPYLNLFRRVIPPLGMFDLSPVVALFVLLILRNLVIGILAGI